MFDFPRYSVRRKLLLISVTSVGLALLVACGALIVYERSVFRHETVQRLLTHAEITGLNSESALLFNDAGSARTTLAAFRAEPGITAVRILDRDGKTFAEYLRDRGAPSPPELDDSMPGVSGHRFVGERLLLSRPILSEGTVIGSVVIVSDLDEIAERIQSYLSIAIAVFAVSLITSLSLSSRLYRSISTPLNELARTAREITAGRGAGVRANVTSKDELSLLADSFNEMLNRIEQRESELRTTMESFRVARDSAQNAAKVKAHFLSLVSHELRTPLTALELNLENLRRGREPLPPRAVEIIERMRVSTRRQAELVESLLETSRLESGKLSVSVGPVDVAALITEVVDEVRAQAEQKQLAVRIDAATVPPLQSDARLLRLVLVNFLSNAVKFTSTGSVVTRLSLEGPFHRIDVSDTGPGIPRASLDQIFEPFEHVEPIDGKHTPGFGLGLSLVRQVSEVLEARIAVHSEVGRGTTFTIFVPALAAAEEGVLADPGAKN